MYIYVSVICLNMGVWQILGGSKLESQVLSEEGVVDMKAD